jgi:hypothetical protein
MAVVQSQTCGRGPWSGCSASPCSRPVDTTKSAGHNEERGNKEQRGNKEERGNKEQRGNKEERG